jgi:acyl-CoA dehydrogenase
MYMGQRALRLADGPDEVHWMVVGRAELAAWKSDATTAEYNPKATALSKGTAHGVQI